MFVWSHGELFRVFHHLLDVPFEAAALYRSSALQASVAALWSIGGLAAIAWGSRYRQRAVWLCGSSLLIAAVAKLFLIDLANSGSLSRIAAFVFVGLVMLSVGYLSPPPKAHAEGKV